MQDLAIRLPMKVFTRRTISIDPLIYIYYYVLWRLLIQSIFFFLFNYFYNRNFSFILLYHSFQLFSKIIHFILTIFNNLSIRSPFFP
jgi:hypothetical protein